MVFQNENFYEILEQQISTPALPIQHRDIIQQLT
jgi:hypothetical protein